MWPILFDGQFGIVTMHRTPSIGGKVQFEGVKLILMNSLALFDYTKLSIWDKLKFEGVELILIHSLVLLFTHYDGRFGIV